MEAEVRALDIALLAVAAAGGVAALVGAVGLSAGRARRLSGLAGSAGRWSKLALLLALLALLWWALPARPTSLALDGRMPMWIGGGALLLVAGMHGRDDVSETSGGTRLVAQALAWLAVLAWAAALADGVGAYL